MGYPIMILGAILAALLPLASLQATELRPVTAPQVANADQAMLLDATVAGARVVAVGDHGVILLSDDRGQSFRQAGAVPISTQLTGVSFVDNDHGWAVGQWGVILATTDGGESWAIQRLSTEEDRPLFAVHFFDELQGVAVGLWSLVLTTDDGGKTWTERSLQAPSGYARADLNLMSLFDDGRGRVYATAERGRLLISDDRGRSWRYLDTGYQGTLWSGAVLADGSLLVGGQRGTLLHGTADAGHWQRIALKGKSSITSIDVSGLHVVVVGLDGVIASSFDGGRTFEERRIGNGASLTAALFIRPDNLQLFSRRGVITEESR